MFAYRESTDNAYTTNDSVYLRGEGPKLYMRVRNPSDPGLSFRGRLTRSVCGSGVTLRGLC